MKHLTVLVLIAAAGCASLPQESMEQRRIAVDSYTVLAERAIAEQRGQDATELMLSAAEISTAPYYAERATRMADELGLTELGLQSANRWEELAPDDDGPFWFRGLFQMRSGLFDESTESFTALMDSLGEDDQRVGFALLTQALSEEPNAAAATYVMAQLVMRYPGRPEAHYGLARLAFRSGDFDVALENASRAAELEPDWFDAQMLYARTLLVAGRTDESLELAAKLSEENENVEARLQYAELLLSAGRGDEAKAILNDMLEENPELIEATRALAFLALSENQLDEAQRYFENMRNEDVYRDETFYYLGRIAESKGDQLQATRAYSRVTDGTHAVEAQLRTARIMYDQTGDPETALVHLEEFGSANPIFATDMLVARGQILMQIGRTDAAMQMIDEALEASPSDQTLQNAQVSFFIDLSQRASNSDDLEQAQRWLDQGLAKYPSDSSLRYSQALLYEDQGRMRKAADVLERLVEEQPDNPAMLNALGYLLTDQFDRHQEAETYIRRALAMDPDNAAIIDSMGWVLFNLGEYEAALSYLERAARLVTDPEMIAHLVDTHWMLGNHELALQMLKDNLAQFPNDSHLLEVSSRLNQ